MQLTFHFRQVPETIRPAMVEKAEEIIAGNGFKVRKQSSRIIERILLPLIIKCILLLAKFIMQVYPFCFVMHSSTKHSDFDTDAPA